jgi:hypothetical protein
MFEKIRLLCTVALIATIQQTSLAHGACSHKPGCTCVTITVDKKYEGPIGGYYTPCGGDHEIQWNYHNIPHDMKTNTRITVGFLDRVEDLCSLTPTGPTLNLHLGGQYPNIYCKQE